jgi:glycosyltransferase involved in cell wall biosynthesis
MNVLWFTNYPTFSDPILQFEKPYAGVTWVDSLESEIVSRDEFCLAVAFINHKAKTINKKRIGKVTYYSIPYAASRLIRWRNRFFWKLENPGETDKYLDVIKDFQPSLIHLFGSENNFGSVIFRTEIPVIIHLQGIINAIAGHWFDGFTKFESIRYAGLLSLLNGRSFFHKYKQIQKKANRERLILNHCKHFIGRTTWDQNLMSIFSPDSVYHYCSEVLRMEFYEHKWEIPRNDGLNIMSIMNEELYKGLDVIFYTAAILKSKDIKVHWAIAGLSSNDRLVRLAERKMRKKSGSLGIVYLGKIKAKQLVENMLKANVFVHPSYIDNSPNSLCEAMMLGMPVVATYAGGISSLVENNVSGYLVQPGDSFNLASFIIKLYNDTFLSLSIGENARNTASIRHNKETIIKDLVTIYSQVIKVQ